jgi:hypothetical protein
LVAVLLLALSGAAAAASAVGKFVPSDAPRAWRFAASAHATAAHDSATAFRYAEHPAQRSKGFLYSAVGVKSLREAAVSAVSLRRAFAAAANVTVVTDAGGAAWLAARSSVRAQFDVVVVADFADRTWGFRFTKINALLLTPYDNTMFLDADTVFCAHGDRYMHAQLTLMFHVLDRFDFAAVHGTFVADTTVGRPANTDLNSGVSLYRKTPAMFELIRNWRKELMRRATKAGGVGVVKDQGPLANAIRATPSVAVWVLPPEFNCRGQRLCDGRYADFASPFVQCLISHTHDHASQRVWDDWIDGRADAPPLSRVG